MKKVCCNINEVIDEFYYYIKNFTRKKVKDEPVAEDIVQEVMLKLVESHHKNINIENCKAWLFQVARNTIYDHFKENRAVLEMKDKTLLSATDAAEFELTVYDYLQPMIQFLPQKYAKPLQWSDLENISQIEIARKLNISHSAAKMRVQRARVKLRELFVECCDMEYDTNGTFVSCTVKQTCHLLKNHLVDYENSI